MSTEIYAQAGAIPYRYDPSGRLEILLIRRLDKERWGIPKGLIDPGVTPRETARAEAIEEAGVVGTLSDQPVGFFSFNKKKWDAMVHVTVFLLRVTEIQAEYSEQYRREREWFPFNTAVETAGRKGLCELLLEVPKLIKEHLPDAKE
ncbi:MAG: NUDIX hydrolase [Planctomycetes bacterium]|nr:NUDIX hydrolase [Planctomycetota bacterium]